jgi:rhodanese-related sulfurtransferase
MSMTISPREFESIRKQHAALDVIDVRTPAEYRAVHVTGARLHSLDALDASAVKSQRPYEAQGPTYVLCKSGGRAKKAAEQLALAGVECVIVEGGTDACVSAGLPVDRGNSVMSLERQVRIAAGSLVAIGTLLGVTVSPWFLIVPGFVGCGLVFAGVTDWCGMGMLIAKCPWNR